MKLKLFSIAAMVAILAFAFTANAKEITIMEKKLHTLHSYEEVDVEYKFNFNTDPIRVWVEVTLIEEEEADDEGIQGTDSEFPQTPFFSYEPNPDNPKEGKIFYNDGEEQILCAERVKTKSLGIFTKHVVENVNCNFNAYVEERDNGRDGYDDYAIVTLQLN